MNIYNSNFIAHARELDLKSQLKSAKDTISTLEAELLICKSKIKHLKQVNDDIITDINFLRGKVKTYEIMLDKLISHR